MRHIDGRGGCTVLLFVVSVLVSTRATAQLLPAPAVSGEGITGVGVATLERSPNVLRMQVELTAQGTDMADAVKKLRTTESAARKKLAELGATESSVSASPISDANATNSRQAQMEILMRQQMAVPARS